LLNFPRVYSKSSGCASYSSEPFLAGAWERERFDRTRGRRLLGGVTDPLRIPFDNSYARLPERCYARQAPQPVRAPSLIHLNDALAEELGLDARALAGPEGVAVLAGNRIPDGAEPLAMAYAGHQFGHFVPQLGDGRAILLGEVCNAAGERRDLHLKGAGRTPFSRGGDGRAWLGPVIREYIVSEAMHSLGVPTTRALAAVATGEPVMREAALPGAIVTRVAASHIRVGTFEYFAARDDLDALRILADHAIERHFPACREKKEPHQAFLSAVVARQAELIPRWLQVGFIHGVMNTDNMAISGETIDYGPCAFMDEYNPRAVFSSIDRNGRYAYDQQAPIAQWNLARLAETLLALLDPDGRKAIEIANSILSEFGPTFHKEWEARTQAKFGLLGSEDADPELTRGFLEVLARSKADFTRSFRALAELAEDPEDMSSLDTMLGRDPEWADWKKRWLARLARQPADRAEVVQRMKRYNPALIPRNHLVEEAIQRALGDQDYSFMQEMVEVLATPWADHPENSKWTLPPRPEEKVLETFCGT